MAKSIPTIGRRIWFWPVADDEGIIDPHQPFDAGIVFVHPDGLVNLQVTSHLGYVFFAELVTITDTAEEKCAQWMPYQEKQAAKAAAEEAGLTVVKTEPNWP